MMNQKTENSTVRIEQLLKERAASVPAMHIAISAWQGNVWQTCRYATLFQSATQFSQQLISLGIKPGDRVILLAYNTIETVIALLGLWQAKATVALVDPNLPGGEIQIQAQIADAVLLIQPEKNDALQTLFSTRQTLVFTESQWHQINNEITLSSTVKQDRNPDIAALIFTSGTTGDSKAVMLTHQNFTYLMTVFTQYDLGSLSDRSMTVLPIFHVAGLLCGFLQPLFLGAQIIIFRELIPEAIQSAFLEKKPTVMIGVPRLLDMLDQKIMAIINQKSLPVRLLFNTLLQIIYICNRYLKLSLGRKLFDKIHQQFGGCLRKILCGSAILAPYLQKRFLTYGFDVLISYGLTETCGPITFTKPPFQWRSSSVGLCIPNSKIKLGDSDEILYQGPALMAGYFRDPAATALAIQQGWLHTQDIGHIDRKGNVYIVGRKKEWIVFSNGTKAMPEQIERQYKEIMGVEDFAVFADRSDNKTIAVLAFVPQDKYDKNAIKKSLLKKAASLNIPYRVSRIMAVDEIPRSNTLKIKRHLLQQYIETENVTAKSNKRIHDSNDQLQELLSCFYHCMPSKRQLITLQISFVELGVDSLMAVQLCEIINKKLKVNLQPTAFWFYYNIQELFDSIYKNPALTTSSYKKTSSNKIAIVGMVCRYPGGANNPNKLWKNLLAEKDAITEVPVSRWKLDDYYDDYVLAPGKMNTRYGGFINLPDDFDPALFKIKPPQAAAMDPQQKLLLQLARQLLLDYQLAATNLDFWAASKTGVFIGAELPDYMMLYEKNHDIASVSPYTGIGMSDFALASRIAYHFGLVGPSMVLKTACSSSLVAVHQAVRALQAGDCDFAIAGGVNLILLPDFSVSLAKAGFLSPDGRCKVFDKSANGYVRSEGCGLVLLKPYDRAVSEKDEILAVIEGTAINQDGASNGLTAPNGSSQVACYLSALAAANKTPEDIVYIESHGTGTQLGDAIEIRSIQAVYDTDYKQPLYVGAVKSNIGHCEAAAGIAGLIKTVQVLQHQTIPANLHYHTPNPNIDLVNSRIKLPSKTTNISLSHAALSSFGIAGTNVHMIIGKS